jgi:hypothetical protein
MTARHLELLVEDASMEAFLSMLLPRLLPRDRTFQVHPFQGKPDLLAKLEARLRGYASWLPRDWRVLVVVDRDDDCRDLKARMEAVATRAGLQTRSNAWAAPWQVANRIAIEELEAWYFGSWEAVCAAFPGVSPAIPGRAGYRDPDAIRGGTWEAFERVLRRHGFFETGLRKIEAARAIGALLDPASTRSRSFKKLHETIEEAVA